MKLNEFILHLQELAGEGHGDKDVMFQYNCGDHWRTTVAAKADSAEPMYVKWSDYHSMYKLAEESEDILEQEGEEVIIIG